MYYFILAIVIPTLLLGNPTETAFPNVEAISSSYTRPSNIDEDKWNQISQYFLPEDHPIKTSLDRIFTESRPTLNRQALIDAGFRKTKPRSYSRTIVSSHSQLKGYLLKIYTDDNPKDELKEFINRITGAESIREAIQQKGYSHHFKVPHKWLYPLPQNSAGQHGHHRKNFVLVVEEVDILSNESNYRLWAGAAMSPRLLREVYELITDLGLDDSIFPFNIPFTKSGKLAFVDTTQHHRWPIPYHRLTKYLSGPMQSYWKKLVINGARKKRK